MRYYGIIESIQGDEFTAGVYSTESRDKISEFTDKLKLFKGPVVPAEGVAFASDGYYFKASLYWAWWHQRKSDATPSSPLSDVLQKTIIDTMVNQLLKTNPKGQ